MDGLGVQWGVSPDGERLAATIWAAACMRGRWMGLKGTPKDKVELIGALVEQPSGESSAELDQAAITKIKFSAELDPDAPFEIGELGREVLKDDPVVRKKSSSEATKKHRCGLNAAFDLDDGKAVFEFH